MVKTYVLRLPDSIVEKLNLRAQELSVPKSSIVKQILHEALKDGE